MRFRHAPPRPDAGLDREPPPSLPEEVLELLRDEPGLLAIADAIRTTQRGHEPRSIVPRLVLVAAVVGVAVLLALVVPWQARGTNVIRRAAQAAGNTRLLHLTVKTARPVKIAVDPTTGDIVRAVVVVSSTYDRETMRAHTRVQPGKRRSVTSEVRALATSVGEFAASYRRALQARQATVTGRSGGLIWIRLRRAHDIREVGLNPKTYRPVELRLASADSTGGVVLDVVAFTSSGH